jgi:predicted negative regulator of RcsB-dependent stress response
MKAQTWVVIVFGFVVGWTVFGVAQEKPTAPPATKTSNPVATIPAAKADPVLAEVDKLKVQNVLLRIELAQRTIQQAQADFEKARTEAQSLIQGLQVPGYTLDLQTLTYTAAKPPALPEKK